MRSKLEDGQWNFQHSANLELIKGSISDYENIDELLHGADVVICMLGDAQQQQNGPINTPFVKRLIPAMRRQGAKRFLYQAGGFTRRYKEKLPFLTWILKNTLARRAGLLGQHKDNESVIEYLVEEAQDSYLRFELLQQIVLNVGAKDVKPDATNCQDRTSKITRYNPPFRGTTVPLGTQSQTARSVFRQRSLLKY